jgi:hypothetical protein
MKFVYVMTFRSVDLESLKGERRSETVRVFKTRKGAVDHMKSRPIIGEPTEGSKFWSTYAFEDRLITMTARREKVGA